MPLKTRSAVRVVLALIVVAAVAGVAAMRVHSTPTRVEVASPAPAVANAAAVTSGAIPDPADLAARHATANYLPAGAQSTGGRSVIRGGWAEQFTLSGAVNSNEMPGVPTKPTPGVPAHPATTIDFLQLAQDISVLAGVDQRLDDVSTITVMGVQATVVVPKSGYGVSQIDWVKDGVAYDLQSQRLIAGGNEGISGIPMTELIRMAQSIS